MKLEMEELFQRAALAGVQAGDTVCVDGKEVVAKHVLFYGDGSIEVGYLSESGEFHYGWFKKGEEVVAV